MTDGMANGREVCEDILKTEPLNSSGDSGSAGVYLPGASVQRSKFGRIRKPNLSPCMEYTPLVRSHPTNGGQTRKEAAAKEKSKCGTSQYQVGDLLWSKIGQQPFWPAMVSPDPMSGLYMKVVKKNHLQYHVQYFGEGAKHGWTQPRRVLPFEGLAKFSALGDLKRPPYAVSLRHKHAWKVAVDEATAAMELTRAQRKQKLTKHCDLPAKPARNVKAMRPLQENRSVEKVKDELCLVCEKVGGTLTCMGPCKTSFHVDCLGVGHPPANFQCEECTEGKHPCRLCSNAEDTQKCSLESCGSFYHMACLKSSPLPHKEEPLVCPRHFCLYCFQQKPRCFSTKGRLLRCMRCPSTFHHGCLPAGSSILNPSAIVCPRHASPKPPRACTNVNWCMLCSEGGRLLCCEGCPAALHEECLGLQEVPEGPFFCPDCLEWKHPKYGDIIWVKLGCYRWWPAQVCEPGDIPVNIQALKHEPIGDFAVRFYGSHDYYWTHKRKVFLFEEGDSGSLTASSKSVARSFEAALAEVTLAVAQQRQAREKSEKPAPYRSIRINRPVGQAAMQAPSVDRYTGSACQCEDPKDPCRTNCLNRLTLYECNPCLCPIGALCENQRFQKRQYAQVSLVRSPGRGWGLRADQPLAAGDFVMEYVGEVIDEVECQRRLAKLHVDNAKNFYFLNLEKDRFIDAGPRGNLSRFINHSCEPNCETQKWKVNGDIRVGIFAICDIASGTELTFNYNLDSLGNDRIPCVCGAKNCSGFLGLRASKPAGCEPKQKRRKGTHKTKCD